jgi:hypothetical protein
MRMKYLHRKKAFDMKHQCHSQAYGNLKLYKTPFTRSVKNKHYNLSVLKRSISDLITLYMTYCSFTHASLQRCNIRVRTEINIHIIHNEGLLIYPLNLNARQSLSLIYTKIIIIALSHCKDSKNIISTFDLILKSVN